MNIAVIDQHPVLRSGMSVLLKDHFADLNILETTCLSSFKQDRIHQYFDIIIIGLAEECEGIDQAALKRIMRENPGSSFVVYAGKLQYEQAVSLMKVGVRGYLLKNNRPEELLTCIKTVISGNNYLCSEVRNFS
ncbi:response regulator [Dyadobacter pollutisoli]|uniref:Response regulator n=1 Tax=Dyadobacter pollutisoli TaxID=2910158 RepID=A0A9E8NFD5_9BACT|nr:response regulator [Dyadobacter pollutisoli]WAC13556.1 response regulator [Dyadobacter pollutisoli]